MYVNSPYDVECLTYETKKQLRSDVLWLIIYVAVLVSSIAVIILLGSYLPILITEILFVCVSAFLCANQLRKIRFSDYNQFVGEIEAVHKEVKTVRTGKVGGINPFGVRKYDQDAKKEIRLIILINDGKRVRTYYLDDVTEEHAAYYEAKGKAVHIWGTHFPVRLDACEGKWLCPVCGEFGVSGEKTCARCKRKVLK